MTVMTSRSKPPEAAAAKPSVGYLRRSTDRQEQSLHDQKNAIEVYAAERSYDVQRFYTDDAISGTSTEDRKAFLQMIADAQNGGGFRFVLVYDIRRFGRTGTDEAGHFRFLLQKAGVALGGLVNVLSEEGRYADAELPLRRWLAISPEPEFAPATLRTRRSCCARSARRRGALHFPAIELRTALISNECSCTQEPTDSAIVEQADQWNGAKARDYLGWHRTGGNERHPG